MNATPDHLSPSDLNRLTAKERECLARWLDHATAKQIALELGVSHHAVEKRLKSARQKLGVTTTLDAARRLAGENGYGRTASQLPELSDDMRGADDASVELLDATPAPSARRIWTIILGVIIMGFILLTALALSGGLATAPGAATPNVRVVKVSGGDRTELDAAFGEVFTRMDKNRDGFLGKGELARDQLRVQQVSGASAAGGQSEVKRMSNWDSDHDGKVSLAEFRTAMGKLTAHVR